MKKIQKILLIVLIISTMISCKEEGLKADGYGNFEATEITISSQSNGKLMAFELEEGQKLEKGKFIGYTDTVPLQLKKEQLLINKGTINAKSKGVLSKISIYQSQLKTAYINKKRVENLIADNAGTQKQLDDVNGKIDVIKQQISSVKMQNSPIVKEYNNINIQVKQIEDKIEKCKIVNPTEGTVLVKYAEPNEITGFGRPLYKIADLETMQLRVYISETQLTNIKLNQEVSIKVDAGESMKTYKGKISWIASEAEFTPKIIQTKEERVALVYAVKINVENDGSLKIGMPAEMWIEEPSVEEKGKSGKSN